MHLLHDKNADFVKNPAVSLRFLRDSSVLKYKCCCPEILESMVDKSRKKV